LTRTVPGANALSTISTADVPPESEGSLSPPHADTATSAEANSSEHPNVRRRIGTSTASPAKATEIAAANYCGTVIYIHEQLELQPGKTDEFLSRFENDYEPLMVDLGARLVHVWETVAISLPWPMAIWMWEVDDIAHYAKVANAQYRDRARTPKFREWRNATAGFATKGEGRILTPSKKTPTLADIEADGFSLDVCVHEWVTAQPDKEHDYAENIGRLWAPYAINHGRRWIGTYTTNWKNHECISIWALEKGYDTMPENYEAPWFSLMEQEGIAAWMSVAIALRERYDDGLMHSLRPTGWQ
jgi:hypothetical protein